MQSSPPWFRLCLGRDACGKSRNKIAAFSFLKYSLPCRKDATTSTAPAPMRNGHSDELVGRIQLRYGIQKESARKQPKSWEGAI